MFALVAAGGTGGHVYPGIAVADALIAIGHPVSAVRFVTESRSTTTTEIANAGYAYDILALEHGLQRRFPCTRLRPGRLQHDQRVIYLIL